MRKSDRYFFEIPVYRCTIEDYTEAMEEEKRRYLEPFDPNHQYYAKAELAFDRELLYPWRYNEAVGWIRLHTLGTQIRGDVWFVKQKRIMRRGRRGFRYSHKAFEMNCYPADSSQAIFEKLLAELEAIRKRSPFRGRYIDLECLRQIGEFVDWRGLVGIARARP